MNSNIKPVTRQTDLVVQELSGEILIYDLTGHKAFCLNQTAAFVWQNADGETSVEQIAYLLQRKLKTPVDEMIVWLALEQLEKDGLLENKIAAPQVFAGMKRRELLHMLGRSAAVSLPLVMMITAPTAASAASLRADGQTCTNGAQCSGGGCVNSQCCSAAGHSCGLCCTTLYCDSSTHTCKSGRPSG